MRRTSPSRHHSILVIKEFNPFTVKNDHGNELKPVGRLQIPHWRMARHIGKLSCNT
jgi:hypothetical protein